MSEISQGGVIESDGRLSLGDQILSVNGEDIRAVTQDYAHTLLQVLHNRFPTGQPTDKHLIMLFVLLRL